MTSRVGWFRSLLGVLLLAIILGGCGNDSSPDNVTRPEPVKSADGISGKYVAGLKREDGVTELYRVDLSREGDALTGTMYYLSTIFDSLEEYADNPQKVDLQVFENFSQRPVKLTGTINGTAVELKPEPLEVGNYVFNWHFTGQVQGDKLAGQLDEKMQLDEADNQRKGAEQKSENPQTMNITFTRVAEVK